MSSELVAPLTFIRRGQPVTLRNVPPERTLLEVLREDLNLCATKEGCGEGDCGACTVLLAEAQDGALRYRAVNSCIRLAHSVHGMAVFSADDLAAPDGSLHPVQQALVQCHASQCGFCTPGFVMSLLGMYHNHSTGISREQAQVDLSGNLCRCTGYRPILDAAETMHSLPLPAGCGIDTTATLAALQALPAHSHTSGAYLRPSRLSELLQLRAQHPQAQVVAGCTDVGLWVTKQHRRFDQVLDVTATHELRQVHTHPSHWLVGAAVSLTDAFAALVSEHPQLQTFAQRFAGLPVRNAGTLGGNVANGSPIGDSMPLLIALGARVVLMRWQATPDGGEPAQRELPLEDLYTGYRTNVMLADELLCFIKVPRPDRPSPQPSPASGRGSETQTATSTNESPTGDDALPPIPSAATGGGDALTGPKHTLLPPLPPAATGGGDALTRPTHTLLPPLPPAGEGWGEGAPAFLRVYKISKRFDDDISAVCLAIQLQLHAGRVQHIAIGAGGVAATPVRARQTEAALQGQPWNADTVRAAMATLRAEFQPISDMRASAHYRHTVLGNLLQRFWLESQGMTAINLDNTQTLEALA